VDSAGWSTAKDVINGTILYMSPEQLQGFRATVRSDVYAVGLMLYEALLGRHPCLLSNPSPTVRELALIQRVKQPPLLSELDRAIPRHVARAVARAMEKVPEKRVQSLTELRAALAACLERLAADGLAEEPARLPSPAAASAFSERHDTEPLSPQDLFGPTPKLEAAAAPPEPELASWDRRTHTAPPVITESHSDFGADERRRALRRVVAAGAVVGTLCGVALYFVLPRPHRAAALGAPEQPLGALKLTAHAVTATISAAARGTETVAASAVTIAPSTSAAAARVAAASVTLVPSASPPPHVAAPMRHGATPKKHLAPTAPEREVWIE
jgi:hypothetical protein